MVGNINLVLVRLVLVPGRDRFPANFLRRLLR